MYLSSKEKYELYLMVLDRICIYDALDEGLKHRLSKERQFLDKLYKKLSFKDKSN